MTGYGWVLLGAMVLATAIVLYFNREIVVRWWKNRK